MRGTLLSPPVVNARRWQPHHHRREERTFTSRNAQLTPLQRLGRTEWKKQSGYNQSSFVEATNQRLKSLTGDRLAERTPARQTVDVRLRCKALNTLAVPTWQAKPDLSTGQGRCELRIEFCDNRLPSAPSRALDQEVWGDRG